MTTQTFTTHHWDDRAQPYLTDAQGIYLAGKDGRVMQQTNPDLRLTLCGQDGFAVAGRTVDRWVNTDCPDCLAVAAATA